ncbi:MAG: benzoyl-CoA 2,3-epoxidase subunit BoxA [Aestuariivita sp.]|nr:benzoyl-CoA 2,3-epoxidase subunit BoxA [Aestuariivita sp.]
MPQKQHLIDPEICIRCYTCEMTCPINAIEHNEDNVVVDARICNFCMACIPVCPTGSIDEWRVVDEPYSMDEQLSWSELPEQDVTVHTDADQEEGDRISDDDPIVALLAEAHKGVGGVSRAPVSASRPTVNLYRPNQPMKATVQGIYRLTSENSDSEVYHIILDFGGKPFPVIEGQSIGVLPPGLDEHGKSYLPRLYSVSSPRDGERSGYHNVSLTVKREEQGICSNFLCNLGLGDTVKIAGPFGSTFLLPSDPEARLLMICTGTGSAPMRAFTMARRRTAGVQNGRMVMFFGARTPDSLPYFGPLKKVPSKFLKKYLVYSRQPGQKKEYVQDRMLVERELVAGMLQDAHTHIYICGLKAMEDGVDKAFRNIAESVGLKWSRCREVMREESRYHVETY